MTTVRRTSSPASHGFAIDLPRWLPIGLTGPAAFVLQIFAIVVVSQLVLLVGIDQPNQPYFDEVHYVPAARALLYHLDPINLQHPPLAKWLMALSMATFGDGPLGWRYASVLFGSLALAGVYAWALALFGDRRPALWATVVTLLDQALYVQARIAMLDIFALAFSLWGLAAFTATWTRPSPAWTRALFLGAGACFGLSAACKWSGLFPFALVIAIVATVRLFQLWRVSFADPAPSDWYRPELWRGMSGWDWVLALLIVPALSYYVCFASLGPDLLLPVNFVAAQARIFGDNSTMTSTHPYMSHWPEWPVLHRDVWYFFEGAKWDTKDASARAVVFLGNPLVLWTGLIGVVACGYGWLRARRYDAFIVVAAYCACWLCWAVMPRQLTFEFYYLPAATVISLALAYLFYRTGLEHRPWARRLFLLSACVMFLYLLPVSNAAVQVSEAQYNTLMWMKSWR